MNINNKTAGLSLLLPAALNPALAAALGIGIIGFGIYRLLGDDEECQTPEGLLERSPTVASTFDGRDSFGTDDAPTVLIAQCPQDDPQVADSEPRNGDKSDAKQKIIREAMSELGKRSAAARVRKKLQAKGL